MDITAPEISKQQATVATRVRNPDVTGIFIGKYFSFDSLIEGCDEIDERRMQRKLCLPKNSNPNDYLFGSAAYKNYLNYISYEQMILNEIVNHDKEEMEADLLEKKEDIVQALQAAKGLRIRQLFFVLSFQIYSTEDLPKRAIQEEALTHSPILFSTD